MCTLFRLQKSLTDIEKEHDITTRWQQADTQFIEHWHHMEETRRTEQLTQLLELALQNSWPIGQLAWRL